MSFIAHLRWPIRGLGLGTPANLAFLSPSGRSRLGRLTLISLLIGMVSAFLAVLGADQIFFAGESLPRIKAAGALPVGVRVLIVVLN
jgi:hypothetical protein